MSLRIVFIGAGNLATRLALELKQKGFEIVQIYSRSTVSAARLANITGANYTTQTGDIISDADIYFVALKDSVIDDVLSHINFNNNPVVHCSGSLPMKVLSPYTAHIGVLYPLQTFSKNQEVDFNSIPIFIEGNSKEVEEQLLNIAGKISSKTTLLNSEKRLHLHIAAVFACNFVNHFYTVASDVLKAQELPFNVMNPLIAETARKAMSMTPSSAQTGPAVRYDQEIIDKHLKTLASYPQFQKLYGEVSLSIYNYYQNNPDALY